jgi:hypothetical protein
MANPERHHGDIIRYVKDRAIGFIKVSNETNFRDFAFHIDNVRRDNLLSRAWCLVEQGSIPVTFLRNQKKEGNWAEDVAPLFPFEEVEDHSLSRKVSPKVLFIIQT